MKGLILLPSFLTVCLKVILHTGVYVILNRNFYEYMSYREGFTSKWKLVEKPRNFHNVDWKSLWELDEVTPSLQVSVAARICDNIQCSLYCILRNSVLPTWILPEKSFCTSKVLPDERRVTIKVINKNLI